MSRSAVDSMKYGNLSDFPIEDVHEFFGTGGPFIRQRGLSDYWILQVLFSDICPVISKSECMKASALCLANRDRSDEIYVQDFLVSDELRGSNVSQDLLNILEESARNKGYTGLWLTSEPENKIATRFWITNGFKNEKSDMLEEGVFLTKDLKGVGQHRAVFRKILK